MSQEIEAFFGELYSVKIKKAVLQGRANGESIRETAIRLNVTDERIRQVEAKITTHRKTLPKRINSIFSGSVLR